MKTRAIVLLCYRAIALFVACCMFPTVSFAKKTVHPIKLFDHKMHTDNFFTPSKVPCETCHIKDQYEWKGMDHEGCHKCHNSKKPLMDGATQDCSVCHANYPVKPVNHKVNWISEHKTEAKVNAKECKSCHTDRFCIKCHEERGDIELYVHKRNYRYFHSIDARADPKKCDRCHTVTYCNKCHSNPRGR